MSSSYEHQRQENSIPAEVLAQAERQGRIVLLATGKLPCTIMLQHSQMVGYLREMGKTNPMALEFITRIIAEN